MSMYENFSVTDRWSQQQLHCVWRANIVAIATRHADAVDIRFEVNDRAVWIVLPCTAWVEYKQRTGNVITDYLAAQIAGHYLKTAVESGFDNGREMYTLTVAETIEHLESVMEEVRHTDNLPSLPVIA